MKKIQIILLLIVIQICNAQEYKKINSSTISYKKNSLFSKSNIVIINNNKTKLSEGFYETVFKNKTAKFYISEKGNVDGDFKEFGSDGLLECKTVLKEGVLEKIIYLDSKGKMADSLQIVNQDIERYDNTLKKWVMKTSLIYSNYSFFENGALFELYYGDNEGKIKTISYYKNGKIMTDKNNFNYTKQYDSLGSLTKQINYNWKKKEIETIHYQNEIPNFKTIVFDENEIWNTNGTITRSKKTNNLSSKSKSYQIDTFYYPSGKIKEIISKGETLKEYTEEGALIERKYPEMVKMIDDTPREEKVKEEFNYDNNENKIYKKEEVEVKPDFVNGTNAFYEFFYKNFIKPVEGELRGIVFLSFIVEKDGSLTDLKIIRDIGYGTGSEAIRVLKLSPKWIPAEQKGNKVRCLYSLNIPIKYYN